MRGRILLTGVIVTALAGFTAAASVASFTAETTNPTNKFATGTLVLSNKVPIRGEARDVVGFLGVKDTFVTVRGP